MVLKSKIAVITGVGSGIGREAARLFSASGADIIGLDINNERMPELEAEIQGHGVQFAGYCCDVRDSDAVREALSGAAERFGRIDIVLNIAGVSNNRPLTRITDDEYDRIMDINVKGMFNLCRHAVPYMKKQCRGVIINTSSVTAIHGSGMGCPYSASKAAIIGMTKSLAIELAPWNIRVNSVAPGVVDTEMVGALNERSKKTFENTIPLGRMGHAYDIAAAMRFLASDDAEYITGTVINVDGGYRPSTINR